MENKPTRVPETAKPVGDIRARWGWVESEVWTDRMLMALENGVKGGKWFSLIDKVYAPGTLRKAFARVAANAGAAGVDGWSVTRYAAELEDNLERLATELRHGTYQPRGVRRVWIPKPGGTRPLGIPAVVDRVVQTALRMTLEPIFERDFAAHSYGFRPGKGCKDALRRVDGLLKDGLTWVVEVDIRNYFDAIDQGRLMALVEAKVSDGRVLDLLGQYLRQEVVETARTWTPTSGTPQGAVISPLLSNIYLNPLDHLMKDHAMTRYADDLVIQCRSETEARFALEQVRAWMTEAGLELHPDKTRIVDATQPGGFEFLGYRFEQGRKWPSRKSFSAFKDRVRALTRRSTGQSLTSVITTLNRTLRGWFEYFKHSHRFIFKRADGWIRTRLRTILHARRRGDGRSRAGAKYQWPNAYFTRHGLFSLSHAHAEAINPR